ncbi:unnamed protein product, partial [Iphiclides podalirius]
MCRDYASPPNVARFPKFIDPERDGRSDLHFVSEFPAAIKYRRTLRTFVPPKTPDASSFRGRTRHDAVSNDVRVFPVCARMGLSGVAFARDRAARIAAAPAVFFYGGIVNPRTQLSTDRGGGVCVSAESDARVRRNGGGIFRKCSATDALTAYSARSVELCSQSVCP